MLGCGFSFEAFAKCVQETATIGALFGSSRPEVFLGRGVLKIYFATLLKSHFRMGVLL